MEVKQKKLKDLIIMREIMNDNLTNLKNQILYISNNQFNIDILEPFENYSYKYQFSIKYLFKLLASKYNDNGLFYKKIDLTKYNDINLYWYSKEINDMCNKNIQYIEKKHKKLINQMYDLVNEIVENCLCVDDTYLKKIFSSYYTNKKDFKQKFSLFLDILTLMLETTIKSDVEFNKNEMRILLNSFFNIYEIDISNNNIDISKIYNDYYNNILKNCKEEKLDDLILFFL
jgi:hypothetical protein